MNPIDEEIDAEIRAEVALEEDEALTYIPTIVIYQGCTGEWIDESTVKIEDVYEDMLGQDVVTWNCSHCGETHKSIRRG